MPRTRITILPALLLTASLLLAADTRDTSRDPAAAPPAYAPGRELARLQNPAICESSGLAASRVNAHVFWTHNDSGDGPRLFAFDGAGRSLAVLTLTGAAAHDWEDMCSFTAAGRHVLLVGDIGDNNGLRKNYALYAVTEPRLPADRPLEAAVPPDQTITFNYDDGPHNCEALAVDPTDRTIYLVIKVIGPKCNVYAMPWPADDNPKTVHIAKQIGTLDIATTTAMDISPDGRRAVVLTYGDAWEYTRAPNETWSQAFTRAPRRLKMPRRVQGESLCFGPDGRTLYLTSECKNRDTAKDPSPLLEVPVERK
ncbi:MAG: hypothetical protein GC159_12195 [Phycisphaera sp.]|nr:hypothetical protein [Phycisphaera sp.]